MYTMSEKTRKNLERSLGISLQELGRMSADEERSWMEKKVGHPLTYSKKRKKWRIGRGNPWLSRKKLRTNEDLENKISYLFNIQ